MPNCRILSAKERRELYNKIIPNETVIEVVGGKCSGFIGTVVKKSSYYGSRVNRINNYFMVTIQLKNKKTQVGCNNIKIHKEEKNMSNRLILKGLFKGDEQEVNNVTNMAFNRDENGQPIAVIWVDGKMSKEIPFDDLMELTPMVETDEE